MKKQAFIFDLDDTLYDQFLIFSQGFNRFLELNNVDEVFNKIPETVLRSIYIKSRYYGDQNFETIQKYPEKRFYYDSLRIRLAFEDYGYTLTEEQTNEIDSLYKEEQDNLVLAPGMKTCLEELKQAGKFIGIVTNGYSVQQRNKLKALAIYSILPEEQVLVSADTKWMKPQRELFDFYIEQHQLNNSEVYYIGDSYENDVRGAWNSGIIPIWLNKKNQLVETGDTNLYHVTNYDDLYSVLKKISSF